VLLYERARREEADMIRYNTTGVGGREEIKMAAAAAAAVERF